jgi:plasmid maintenance system antidote protein VapI
MDRTEEAWINFKKQNELIQASNMERIEEACINFKKQNELDPSIKPG